MTSLPPRRLTHPPTAEVAAAQDEHDRMARNRASPWRPSMRDDAPAEDPLVRQAFVLAQMAQAVEQARHALYDAKQAMLTTSGKAAKQAARNTVRLASRALSEAEAALVREKQEELVAPAVQRGEIKRDDVVIREARLVVTQGRRAELMPALERLRARDAISKRCYHAGRWYREIWEMAGMDAFPVGLGGDGGRTAPASGNRRIEDAIGSSADLDSARRAIGVFGTAMLEHVVIEGLTLAAWAERKAVSEHVAKGMFVMVLEQLAEHRGDRG